LSAQLPLEISPGLTKEFCVLGYFDKQLPQEDVYIKITIADNYNKKYSTKAEIPFVVLEPEKK
jgi:hypothetical protein